MEPTQTTTPRSTPTTKPYLFQRNDEDKSSHAITIGASPAQIYAFWRKFENLAFFMKDLESVTMKSNDVTHWVVKLQSGLKAEWDARITSDRPGQMIAWESLEGSEVMTKGSVFFYPAPQGLGTIVSLSMDYNVPGGKLTELLTKFVGEDPDTLILTNLKRLKGYLETGEVATTKGQTSGREDDAEVSLH